MRTKRRCSRLKTSTLSLTISPFWWIWRGMWNMDTLTWPTTWRDWGMKLRLCANWKRCGMPERDCENSRLTWMRTCLTAGSCRSLDTWLARSLKTTPPWPTCTPCGAKRETMSPSSVSTKKSRNLKRRIPTSTSPLFMTPNKQKTSESRSTSELLLLTKLTTFWKLALQMEDNWVGLPKRNCLRQSNAWLTMTLTISLRWTTKLPKFCPRMLTCPV